MTQNKIDYKTVMDLGFERENQTDSVFYDRYGFNWFIVTKKLLSKKIKLDWDCNTHLVTMIRLDKKKNIIGTLYVETLNELECLVKYEKMLNEAIVNQTSTKYSKG